MENNNTHSKLVSDLSFYDNVYQDFLNRDFYIDKSINSFIQFLKDVYPNGILLPIDSKYVKY